MMEQQVWSLIEETLLVVVLKLMKLDRHVEELRMVITVVVDTEKYCIKSCYVDKKRCDDELQPMQMDPDTFHASSVLHLHVPHVG
nr:hypothetical protein [Tanacetum cinerariifolium]